MKENNGKTRIVIIIAIVVVSIATYFFVNGTQSMKPLSGAKAADVKVMQVIQQDTPIIYSYAGQVQAKDSVTLQANVTGHIVEKMVKGGENVAEGQPLFRLDSRQYESNLLTAQAQLAEAQAALSNLHKDALRAQQLADASAISKQTLDTQMSAEQQGAAAVEAYQAKLKQAQDDMQDTVIVSPMSGKVSLDNLSSGNFVQAGVTKIATISSLDPIYVQFSMSENEYLQLMHTGESVGNGRWGNEISLLLSDGSKYPYVGRISEVNSQISQNMGTLTLKAIFANPQGLLMPGMFTRVQILGELRKDALLIPQRAVQQLLDKTFVNVVNGEGKAEMREVVLGVKVGNLWMVNSGLTPTDQVIVEGSLKLQPGTTLNISTMGLEELNNISR